MHTIIRKLFIVFSIGLFSNSALARLNLDQSYSSGIWHRDYSSLIKDRLTYDRHQTLMNISSGYVSELCPRYDRLKRQDRENFWVTFFMAVAYAESDFNHYSGPMSGIMQLTCDNNARIGYGCSMCTSNSRLKKSPLIGIDCAMNIVSHWAKRGRLVGQHPYFETLRRNKHYTRKIKPTVQIYAPKECGNNYKYNGYDWPLKSNKIANSWPYGGLI
jgi:hypothetical protein